MWNPAFARAIEVAAPNPLEAPSISAQLSSDVFDDVHMWGDGAVMADLAGHCGAGLCTNDNA